MLVKFGGPAISKALAARHQQLKADLAAASEARAAAEARFEQQEQRLAALEQEIAAIARRHQAEAEAEKARLIAHGRGARQAHPRGDRVRPRAAGEGGRGRRCGARWPRPRSNAGREDGPTQSLVAADQQRLLDTFVATSPPTCARTPRARAAPPRAARPGADLRWRPWAVLRRASLRARAVRDRRRQPARSRRSGEELGELAALWNESAELRQALENPVFRPSREARRAGEAPAAGGADARGAALRRCCCSSAAASLLLPAIARAYRDLADAHARRVRAEVTSAEQLAPATLDRVRRSLEQRTGKKVIVEAPVDPDLIGGVVARVGDLVLDGSVRTQLGRPAARSSSTKTTSNQKSDEETRHANSRRRDQPDHPQADRGLRQEGRRSPRPAPCSRPATASRASTASTARWPASCSSSATAASSAWC